MIITLILAISVIFLYVVGAVLTMLLTGWEMLYFPDFIKIVTWPISIFISKK
jgi:hypothetical protein